MSRIHHFETIDVRFPTSVDLDGSDAMNSDPDYSAACVVLQTDAGDGLEGHGFVFTIGRGNEVQTIALEAVAEVLLGHDAEALLADMGGTWRTLVHDSQLRWLGPEKGVMHMAIGAVVNALWDLKAKRAGLPLWRLLAEMRPRELVSLVDFRYLMNALTPDEALEILETGWADRADRIEDLERDGYPAYTTSPGWLGYSDEKLARLCREALVDGFSMIKLKVGLDANEDRRRLSIARNVCGPDFPIAIDANQRWEPAEAIRRVRELAPLGVAWIEEPTSPDDILGHAEIAAGVAPTPVATGEHVANRVVFKQLMQAQGVGVVQIDATRVAGVNENIAILLLAAKFGLPVCPHAGGVGLCEVVSHLSFFDYVAVSGTKAGRRIEYVDHLHEHFVDPVDVRAGRYWPSTRPGTSAQMTTRSIADFRYPGGPAWSRGVTGRGGTDRAAPPDGNGATRGQDRP